jgi:hypothetical protein
VELELRFPDEIENFTEVLATFAGTSGIGGSSCWALISASSCYARERLVWTLTVPAGGGVSVSAPPAVDTGAAAGSILPFVATVTDRTNGDQATGRRSVVARADPLFELSIDDGADPVAAGGSLTYVVSFGQVEVGPASATLTATVPAGTSFLSASDGGSESGGLVTWALATLDAGEEGSRSFTVSVGGGLPDGSVLESDARVASAAGEARASAATRVEAAGPLDLSLAVTPARILPGEALDAAVTVENTGGVALTNVTVELRLPKEIVAFNESQLPSSGDLTTASCWTGTSSSFCDGWERVVWSFASLAPGATLDLGAAPTLLSGDARPSNGTVIPVQVVATADGLSAASERAAVRVGDGDGVPDPSDNCLLTFNPVQVDTNGDGCGNICDADLTNDGLVGIPDFVLFGPEFGAPAPPSDPDADFTGDGAVGVPDFSVLGVLFGKEAGPGEDPSDRNCNGIPDVGE